MKLSEDKQMFVTFNNGVKMPILGLGTYLSKADEAYDAVLYALQNGYRHLDTAQMYFNEESVGKAIKDSGFNRKEIFITTKLIHHAPKDDIYKSIDESLKKLQTDYIDLLLIHWPNESDEVGLNTWRVFEDLYDKGIVRAIGVSNYQIHHLDYLLAHARIKPVINQVELHPGLQQYPLAKYLKEKNIVLQSFGPFMKGVLLEKPYVDVLNEIAAKHHATLNQIVIAWGLNRGIVMIPKSVTPSRILENFNAKEIVLDEEDMIKIKKLNRGTRVYTDPDNSPWGTYKSIDFLANKR